MLEIMFVEDRARANGTVDYRFTLAGGHAGRPLDVWVNNIHKEYDEDTGSPLIGFGPITHAVEPNFILSQEILDTYSDEIGDVLREMFRN